MNSWIVWLIVTLVGFVTQASSFCLPASALNQKRSRHRRSVPVEVVRHYRNNKQGAETEVVLDEGTDWDMLSKDDEIDTDYWLFHQDDVIEAQQQQQQQHQHQYCLDDTTPVVRGVFCGYRFTEHEYKRLKSAHPDPEE